MFKTFMSLITVALTMAQAQEADHSPKGYWLNEEQTAIIEVAACGDQICGKIVTLKVPNDPETDKPKLDKLNPDDNLKARPILNMQMMMGFRKSGANEYEGGEIYSPKEGKTYSAKFTMTDANTMNLRGYVGVPLFGKTQTWTRKSGAGF